MERTFQIVAVILAGIAAYFLWKGNGDGAFIAGVIGAVSFFLSIRTQVKQRNEEREREEYFEREELEEKQTYEDSNVENEKDYVEK